MSIEEQTTEKHSETQKETQISNVKKNDLEKGKDETKKSKRMIFLSKYKKVLLYVILPVFILFFCCFCVINLSILKDNIGSGKITSEKREVKTFNKILLQVQGTMTIEQGSYESLTIEAEDNILPKIISEVKNDTLIIKLDCPFFNCLLFPREDIKYKVTVKNLKEITINGSGEIDSNQLTTDTLKIIVNGSGDVNMNLNVYELNSTINGSGEFNLSGNTTTQNISIDGSGKYNAEDFNSDNCTVDITGSGNILVNVANELNIKISGSGGVSYKGNPQVTQKISGSGEIKNIN